MVLGNILTPYPRKAVYRYLHGGARVVDVPTAAVYSTLASVPKTTTSKSPPPLNSRVKNQEQTHLPNTMLGPAATWAGGGALCATRKRKHAEQKKKTGPWHPVAPLRGHARGTPCSRAPLKTRRGGTRGTRPPPH
eukprot:CAMPEP_0172017872 /NCGR_PEP_ID=MMETSP1041-20130122/11800_1 /TAXON_ID=464988 /ORGANISM="Hemiselmis andersenii, Strain CCMP439" /LENGTH=134 /DNA_ID=CAMNT_0012672939 /DNA_START=46 /DNA_END=447 /DNA_ORIENTATION=-